MSEVVSNKNYKNGYRNRKFKSHSKKQQVLLEEESKIVVTFDNNNSNNNNNNNKNTFYNSTTVGKRENSIFNNKGLETGTDHTRKNKKDLYKNKNFLIYTNNTASISNSHKKTNESLKTSYTRDFTFKNQKEQKKPYCHIGTQTVKPIELHINRIFHQGFESQYNPSLGEETISSNSLFQVDENNIRINDEINYRRSSEDIVSVNFRKWSNASTLTEDCPVNINIPNTFRKSSSISSSATITNTSATANTPFCNNGDFSNQNRIFLKDPYLVKEPLTIEDLNLTNTLKIKRDIKRLKSAINKKNNSDTFIRENNTATDNLQRNDSLTTNINHYEDSNTHSKILMDIWLDYPTCCYNSLIKE